MTFDDWWDTTKPWATPETFEGWEHSCRQAWRRAQTAERERCAAICDGIARQYKDNSHGHAAERAANAIRLDQP
jgi:hypothetical protein